jgi:Asp-tRNA(Asn)/Glu-tRNA(Gln) amidotransferase A subunit family amidase
MGHLYTPRYCYISPLCFTARRRLEVHNLLFAPAVTMPLMSVNGMPVGVQLMGQPHDDARVTALARWLLETVSPVVR